MRGNLFARAEKVNTLDPEYVKLQRKDVLKKYHDQIIELKDEIEKLAERKSNIVEEILSRFSSERGVLEKLEKKAVEKQAILSNEVSDLLSSKKEFKAAMDAEAKDLKSLRLDVERKEKSIKVKGDSLGRESDRLKDLAEKLLASQEKCNEELKSISDRRFMLQSVALKIEKERAALKEDVERNRKASVILAVKEGDVSESEFETRKRSKQIQAEMKELVARTEKAREAERLAANETERLEKIRAFNGKAMVTMKNESNRLEERARRVSIRERAFAKESRMKERELKDRENRIKTLEEGV